MFLSYYAAFHKEDNRYWLEVPDLPGCFSCGEDFITTKIMGKEAIELYLDGIDVELIPAKSTIEDIEMVRRLSHVWVVTSSLP